MRKSLLLLTQILLFVYAEKTLTEGSVDDNCFKCKGSLLECLEKDKIETCERTSYCSLTLNFTSDTLSEEDALQLEARCFENSIDDVECLNHTELIECLQERESCTFCCDSNLCNRVILHEIGEFLNETLSIDDNITAEATTKGSDLTTQQAEDNCFKCKGSLIQCSNEVESGTCKRMSWCGITLNFTSDNLLEEDALQLDAGCYEHSSDVECLNHTELMECLQERESCTFCCDSNLCNWDFVHKIEEYLNETISIDDSITVEATTKGSDSTTQEDSIDFECFSCIGNLTYCLAEEARCFGLEWCVLTMDLANTSISDEDGDDLLIEAGCMQNSTDDMECNMWNVTDLIECLQQREPCTFCCNSTFCNREWLYEISQYLNESTLTSRPESTLTSRHHKTTPGSVVDECLTCQGSIFECFSTAPVTCHREKQCCLILSFANDTSDFNTTSEFNDTSDDNDLILNYGCFTEELDCVDITEMRECLEERQHCTFCCNNSDCQLNYMYELSIILPDIPKYTPSTISTTLSTTSASTSTSHSTPTSTTSASTSTSHSTPTSTTLTTPSSTSATTFTIATTTTHTSTSKSSSATPTQASSASSTSTSTATTQTTISSTSTSTKAPSTSAALSSTSSVQTSSTLSTPSTPSASSSASTSTSASSSATSSSSQPASIATVTATQSTSATATSVSGEIVTQSTTSEVPKSTTTTSTCTTKPPVSLSTIRSSSSAGPPREGRLQCWECVNEEPETCETFIPTPTACEDDPNQWCFATTTYNATLDAFRVVKGCMAKETCLEMASNNDKNCEFGTVKDSCTWCCNDDKCNRERLKYSVEDPDFGCPVRSPCTTDSYQHCLDRFREIVSIASVDPDLQFNHFCRAVPEVYQCISVAMEGCSTCDEDWENLNATLEWLFRNMTSECPLTCDEVAGYNCSHNYYEELIWLLIDEFPVYCAKYTSIKVKQDRCRLKTISSCDASVRRSVNTSFTAIDIFSAEICSINYTLPPPDDPQCVVSKAAECILEVGSEIIEYFNNNGDINEICRLLKIKKECYFEIRNNCTRLVQLSLDAAWNFTFSLVAELCVVAEQPICSTSTARSCVLSLWNLIEEVQDFKAACEQQNETIACVTKQMAGCSDVEKKAMNSSLTMVLGKIGNRCNDIIDITFSSETINIIEGGACAHISYVFLHPPSSICSSSEVNCKLYVETLIDVRADNNNQRCRNRKVIAQAVLQGNGNNNDSLCNREVTESNWKIIQDITICAKVDFKIDGDANRSLVLWFRKDVNGTMTERRSLRNFTLIIHDSDKKNAICSSINDPHMTTFDTWYYNNFQEGSFVLYRHLTLPYEVQVLTQKCNGQASCNCGVNVRSGDTVLSIIKCRPKNQTSILDLFCLFSNKLLCPKVTKVSLWGYTNITPGTKLLTRSCGKEYLIIFPTGTAVKILMDGDYLNVWITASAVDFKQTEGLCGFFDGNKTNDLRLRNGSDYKGKGWNTSGGEPLEITDHWRVQPFEDIYQGVPKQTYNTPRYCECRTDNKKGSDATCDSTSLYENCDMDTTGDLIDKSRFELITKVFSNRKRRDTSESVTGAFDFDLNSVPLEIGDSYYNDTAARDLCQNYFKESTIASLCSEGIASEESKENSMQSCVDDLRATGSTKWMDTAIEVLKHSCLQEISQNSSIPNETVENIVSASCPKQCSQLGTCLNGTCNCNESYTGPDCSFNMSAPLTSVNLFKRSCSITALAPQCAMAHVLGSGFLPDITQCWIEPVNVTEDGVEVDGAWFNVELIFLTENEIICILPEQRSYYISAINDASSSISGRKKRAISSQSELDENASLYVVYDPTCMNCSTGGYNEQKKGNCYRLANSCLINEKCYGPGEENPEDKCQACRPEESVDLWSSSDTVQCSSDEKSQISLILGLCLGLGLGIIVILLVLLIYKWKCAGKTKTERLHKESRGEDFSRI